MAAPESQLAPTEEEKKQEASETPRVITEDSLIVEYNKFFPVHAVLDFSPEGWAASDDRNVRLDCSRDCFYKLVSARTVYTRLDNEGKPGTHLSVARDALRFLWKDLVIRPIYKVVLEDKNKKEDTILARYIDSKTGGGIERFMNMDNLDYNNIVDQLERCCNLTIPEYDFYYGFTHKNEFCSPKYATRRPELRNTAIYFSNHNLAKFSLSAEYTCAYFSHDASAFESIPPPDPSVQQSIIAGIVDKNKKGYYFYKWFYVSPQFLKLYNYVMNDMSEDLNENDICNDEICHEMDMSYCYDWGRQTPCEYYDYRRKSYVSEKMPFKIRESRMHNHMSILTQEMVSVKNTMTLYHLLQFFALGQVCKTNWPRSPVHNTKKEIEEANAKMAAMFYNILHVGPRERELILEQLTSAKQFTHE